MKNALILLSIVFTAAICEANREFQKGCDKGGSEVLCPGHKDCIISGIMHDSKKGNSSEKGGYEECKEFAKFAKTKGITLDEKRVITRLKSIFSAFNKEIKKDFPFITVTADFTRLELELIFLNGVYMDHYGRDKRDSNPIVMMAENDESTWFERNCLNAIKTALNNIGKDQDGKDALKSKVKEIRFAFHTHGRTAFSQDIKIVDKVIIVPGIYAVDRSSYAESVQKFIEKQL